MMRADRDLYVKIIHENMQKGSDKNFRRKENIFYSSRDTPFDFDSVMMYGPRDFGKLEKDGQRMRTILPLVPGITIRCQPSCVHIKFVSKFTSRELETKMDLSFMDKTELARVYSDVTGKYEKSLLIIGAGVKGRDGRISKTKIVEPGYILGKNIWTFPNVSLCASGAQLELDTYSNSTFTD